MQKVSRIIRIFWKTWLLQNQLAQKDAKSTEKNSYCSKKKHQRLILKTFDKEKYEELKFKQRFQKSEK